MKKLLGRWCLPYCIDLQDDGNYVVLNREYKPIGFNKERESAGKEPGYIDYADYPVQIAFDVTPEIAAKISWNGSSDVSRVYLYNDATVPTDSEENMRQYVERLACLMRLKVHPTKVDPLAEHKALVKYITQG